MMSEKFTGEINKIYCGDTLEVLRTFPDDYVDCIITSPPYYGLRDYGIIGQIGLEKTLNEYLEKLLLITIELKRILKKRGTMFWDHGDSYSAIFSGSITGNGVSNDLPNKLTKITRERGKNYRVDGKKFVGRDKEIPEKSLLLQAHRLAIRMTDEQKWILRNILIWHKPNAMPSSVKDRFGVDYEPIFFFTKSKKYYFEQQFEPYTNRINRWGGNYFNLRVRDAEKSKSSQYIASEKEKQQYAIGARTRNLRPNKEGRNKRCIWKIPTKGYADAHFATFPPALIEPMIKAGCPKNGIVLDPFMGSGTTAYVARSLGRNYLGIELNPSYIKLAEKRLAQQVLV